MLNVKATVEGLSQLEKRLTGLGPRMVDGARRAMLAAFKTAVGYASTNYLTGGTTASRLAVRTGHLRKSVSFRIDVAGSNQVGGEFGSFDTPYARLHEFGDPNITPKRGRFLWIPLSANKTASGVARNSPRMIFDTLLVFKSLAGTRIAWQRQGKRLVPMFVLKESVSVPARPWLRPTFERCIVPQISAELDRMIGAEVAR